MSDMLWTSEGDSDDDSSKSAGSDASELFFGIAPDAQSEASTRPWQTVVLARSIDRNELRCCVDPWDEGRQFLPPSIVYLLEPRESWSRANIRRAAQTASLNPRAHKLSL
jgi:hypothetical protein